LWWALAPLAVAVALGVGLGALQANAGQLAIPLPPLVLALGGATVVGLLAGLAARFLLRGWKETLKLLLALLALLIWVVVAEVTYALWTRLHLITYLAGGDDRIEIGQLALGCLGIVVANLVGRPSREAALLRWVLTLLTGSVVLGVGLGLLQAQATVGQLAAPVPPLVLDLIGAGVVGALAGLTTRLILRSWAGAPRFLIALLVLSVWVVVAEATYAALVGLRPLKYLAGANDWVEAGQLAVGCLSIVAISVVGRRTRQVTLLQRLRRDRTPAPTEARVSLWWSLALLAAAAVLGVGLGFLQVNAGQLTASVPPLVLDLVGAGLVGLLAGLTVRFILRGWTEVLKLLAVLLALLVWMLVAEATYAALVGFQPLDYLRRADNNWVEMGQLALGCLGAIVGGVGRRQPGPLEVAPAPRPRREVPLPARRRPRRQHRPSTAPRRRTGPRQAARVRKRAVVSLPQLRLPSRRRRRPMPVRKAPEARVIAKAEDRCPYCLELIEKRDPRGVVVCEICGTPHHKDCWEAGGGKCQVPHLIT
jgi:hypothetical protein